MVCRESPATRPSRTSQGEGVAGGLPGAGVLTLPDPASPSKVEPEAESEAEATGFQKAQSCLFFLCPPSVLLGKWILTLHRQNKNEDRTCKYLSGIGREGVYVCT